MALFFVLYAAAALRYPGGHDVDPHNPGFSFFHNYWCDLLDPLAANGELNGGRPYALAALFVVVGTLAIFWQVVTAHFASARRLVLTTRVAGASSSAATLLLMTVLHDRAVELGAGFGIIALVATLSGLARAGRRRLVTAGISAAILCLVCFFIWRTGMGLPLLAPLQKLAFVAFLGWVFAVSFDLREPLDRRR